MALSPDAAERRAHRGRHRDHGEFLTVTLEPRALFSLGGSLTRSNSFSHGRTRGSDAILVTSVRAINERGPHAAGLVFEAWVILGIFFWRSRLQPGNHFDLDKRILGKTRHLHS